MLLKEYRTPLPFTVEEFHVGSLYSSERFSGLRDRASAIHLEKSARYTTASGTPGLYTHKRYVGGKASLPTWFVRVFGTSALVVHEQCWNEYPHTRSVYRAPASTPAFVLVVDSLYLQDPGTTDNAFHLSEDDLQLRTVQYIDIAAAHADLPDEDPGRVASKQARRGPLAPDWVRTQHPLMCSYKLVRVHFPRWAGLQSTVEGLVMDTLLEQYRLYHRLAYVWMDHWFSLSVDDVVRPGAAEGGDAPPMAALPGVLVRGAGPRRRSALLKWIHPRL